MGEGSLNMGKKIVSFILLILLMIVVWLGLMAVAQLTVGIVATMGIVIFGFILIPIAIRLLVNKVFKINTGSKKLNM
jgi:spore maturation protein SpmA